MKRIKISAFLLTLVCAGDILASEKIAANLWTELAEKREHLTSLHQEFEVSRTYKSVGSTQASTRRLILDGAGPKWRQRSISGSGEFIRIFDGQDEFLMEEGGGEFERIKRKSKSDAPKPEMYGDDAEWTKAVEKERRPCGIAQFPHDCVLLEAPMKPWIRGNSSTISRMSGGRVRVLIDLSTGLILARQSSASYENGKSAYVTDMSYELKRVGYGDTADAALFQLSSANLKEVKELSRWDASKIVKQLGGKQAPELEAKDIAGKLVNLASLKGKVVLLDFWTTWCPPCRADAPALDKLYKKYGDRDLMIVGVSVSEERAIVEKFLKEHPHSFPVVLTSENDMPRPYQIGVFPTYLVIERDGAIASATEGDKGFGELRKMLKKAGLEAE